MICFLIVLYAWKHTATKTLCDHHIIKQGCFRKGVMMSLSALWCHLNSLAPGKFEWHFSYLIFQIISVINGWGISCELALRWTSLDFTEDKSTLVQVMTWCLTAPSHYLSQCWLTSLSPYDVTRPQWVYPIVFKTLLIVQCCSQTDIQPTMPRMKISSASSIHQT